MSSSRSVSSVARRLEIARASLGGALAVALTLMVPSMGRAQQYSIPVVNRFGPTDSSLYVTASDGYQSINDIWGRADRAMTIETFDYPRDSIRGVASEDARRWLARLNDKNVKGIQLDPFARVLAAADEDSAAERALADRLAAPGLTAAERSYTYAVGVEAFADPSKPALMPVAEKYLAKLNAMGPSVATRRLKAELTMMAAYDEIGRSSETAKHGIAAIHLVPYMTLKDCENLFSRYSPYSTIVRAVAIQPNGKAEIAEMNKILAARLTEPADSIALDSEYFWSVKFQRESWATLSKALTRIGEVGGDLESNHWLNMPDTGEGTIRTNDGKVRVILTMTYQCPGCVVTAMHLQQMADADPAMQAVLVTWTADENYGNRVVTPEENEVWQTNFWKDKKIRYPIALYIERAVDTLSDGSIMQSLRDDSTFNRYPETGKPQMYIVDGKGRIRASFFTSSHVIEHQVATIVRRLEREAAQQPEASAAGQ